MEARSVNGVMEGIVDTLDKAREPWHSSTKTTQFRPPLFPQLIKNWTLYHREICLTHHHAPSILIAIGSPEPREGFVTADEVITKREAAEG
jgi:hypothetical protein